MGSAGGLGTRRPRFRASGPADAAFRARLAELLAERDDAWLAAAVGDDGPAPWRRLRRALAAQVARGLVHPVYFGSAVTGAGVAELTAGVAELLPAATGDPAGPCSGTVFKVERGPAGEKVAYVRMFSGTVAVRDRLRFGDREGRVTDIGVFDRGAAVRRGRSPPGRSGSCGAWPRSGSATASAAGRRRPPTASSPRRRRRRWSTPAGRPTGGRCAPPWTSSPTRTP
jgi:ribosomal protection tetracycline resistance protein